MLLACLLHVDGGKQPAAAASAGFMCTVWRVVVCISLHACQGNASTVNLATALDGQVMALSHHATTLAHGERAACSPAQLNAATPEG